MSLFSLQWFSRQNISELMWLEQICLYIPAALEKQRNSDWTVITWLGLSLHLTGCFLFQLGCGIGFLGNKTALLTFLMFCTSILLKVHSTIYQTYPSIIQSGFLLFTAAKTHHLQPKFPLKGLLQLQQPDYIWSGLIFVLSLPATVCLDFTHSTFHLVLISRTFTLAL